MTLWAKVLEWMGLNKAVLVLGALLALGAAGFGLWLYVDGLRDDKVQLQRNLDDRTKERDEARTKLAQCTKDQQTAYEVSNEYQIALSDTRNQLANLKRLRGAGCVIPQRKPSSGLNAGTGTGVDVDAHGRGLSTDWLYDFAGECEGYRLQVIGLQSFITRTRQ